MAVSVRIPTPLRKFTDGLSDVEVDGASVREVIEQLEGKHAGIREKLFDDTGEIRRFINVFLNGEDVRYLQGADTGVQAGDELSIVPAIAGGLSARSSPSVRFCSGV